jgi:hypothetical protein
MAIGRISGSVLKSNLTRNGTDLAFETNLLYLDVTNARIGIGTSEPTTALHVNGNTTITGDLSLSGSFSPGSISLSDNTITTNTSNADLELDASGTGIIKIKSSTTIIQGTSYNLSADDGTGTYVARQYLLWGTTTDATETELFVGGVSGARIPIGSNTTINYSIQIVARSIGSPDESAAWELKALADSFGGTVEDVGNVYEVIVARDDATWVVDARSDNVNKSVGVHVTGSANKTIRWVAEVETSEVSE